MKLIPEKIIERCLSCPYTGWIDASLLECLKLHKIVVTSTIDKDCPLKDAEEWEDKPMLLFRDGDNILREVDIDKLMAMLEMVFKMPQQINQRASDWLLNVLNGDLNLNKKLFKAQLPPEE